MTKVDLGIIQVGFGPRPMLRIDMRNEATTSRI